MALEIVGDLLEGAVRLVGRFLAEFVFEIFIRGTGYLLCRPFQRRIDADGVTVVVVGLAFWLLVAVGVGLAW